MERVNLSSSLLSRHPSELSGGQRQRVAIARALLLKPEVIIADEPTSGLDPMVAAQILDLLIALKKTSGVTILFISHDLNTITYASDRIAVMYRGKIVEMIDGDYFENNAQHPYTRFLRGLDTRIQRQRCLRVCIS
jgi:peptide/nickel transport system ATP-binding protein